MTSLIEALQAECDSACAEERVARDDEAAAYFNGKVTAFRQAIELANQLAPQYLPTGKAGGHSYSEEVT